MLGQLLHSFNPTRRQPTRNQDVVSQIEDVHTKGLLFPDVPFLREVDAMSPATPASEPPDCHMPSDLDLDASRDVRILIAQGETLSLQPLLLFDSKHDPNTEPARPKHTRTSSKGDGISNHARTASGPSRQYGRQPQIASIPESNGRETPTLTGPATALPSPQRSRFRRSSLPTAPNPDLAATLRQKDSDEVVKIALECMFENAPTTYKGISNKIKIVQRESRPYDSTVCKDTFGSQVLGMQSSRTSTVRKPSTLSTSFTASEPPLESHGPTTGVDDFSRTDGQRRTVLITRTFSVKWSDEDAVLSSSDPSDVEKTYATPIVPAVVLEQPSNGTASPQKSRRFLPRSAPKPPMFAITIILSLPVSGGESSRPASRSGGLRRKGSEALTDWTSLGSSFDSGFVIDPLFGLESSTASLSSDVDDRVDKVIGQHWDIIVRTLSSIQQLAEEKILDQLRAVSRRGRPPKLLHQALALDASLNKAAEQACKRIVRGIRILRVRTGQGRWGVWRDEARWLSKWTGDRDKTFLFNLCTAFLGTHTEWLDIAGPRHYRQQHREQLRLGTPHEPTVPHRTVIVSSDKMIARRLVFLLAAFLPANHQIPGDASPLRPSTSASIRGFSQSPPTHTSLSREESLRRTINRRGKRSSSRQTTGSRTPQPSSAQSDADDKTETGTLRNIDQSGHSRHGSLDVRIMMNTKLTAVDSENLRKSNATTSPTIDPNSTMPIAHIGFQRKHSSGQDGILRPDSRDSLASEHLMHTLQRSNTANSLDSQSVSRWGSLRSLWSMGSRRDSSTDYSDAAQNDDEGLGIIGLQQSESGHGRLQKMVDELDTERTRARLNGNSVSDVTSPTAVPATPEIRSPDMELPPGSSTSQPIDVPLKMTVNEHDGVIDVEFPGFSPVNSPPVLGDHPGSSYGSLGRLHSFMPHATRDTGHAMNVAGWLRIGIHPDFELQSTPPYPDLIDDIKAAMRTESSPNMYRILPDGEPKEEWVEVCTTVIADATNCTIKRLRLRRHVRYVPPPPPVMTPMALPRRGLRVPARSQYGNPYDDQLLQLPTQITLEEVFEEEKVTDLDKALMDALERVIAQSGPSSKMSSASSSRANSVRGRNQLSGFDDRLDTPEIPHSDCKKMVIGALEQIATAVERERRDAKKYGGARLRGLHDDTDSSLREGIMKWYDEVEKNRKAIEVQKLEMMKEANGNTTQGKDDTASMTTVRPLRRVQRTSEQPQPHVHIQAPPQQQPALTHELDLSKAVFEEPLAS